MNKVILIGRLGKEPETRYLQNNDPVCAFSLATSEKWNDKQTGEKKEATEWHNIVLYRRLAEIAQQYCHKGDLIAIEGKIQSQKYTGKDGIERTAYRIIASELKMLGSKKEDNRPPPFPPDNTEPPSTPEPQDNLQNNDIPF